MKEYSAIIENFVLPDNLRGDIALVITVER